MSARVEFDRAYRGHNIAVPHGLKLTKPEFQRYVLGASHLFKKWVVAAAQDHRVREGNRG